MYNKSESKEVLGLHNVSFSYDDGTTVFDNISISIHEGEKVGIVGANGCGKTTLFKLICGLLDCEGTIDVCGITLNKKNISDIRRRIGLVFQDSDNQLFMPTVYDEVSFGIRNYGMSQQETDKVVKDILDRLGILQLQYKHNFKLSGGEKKMVCLASILAMSAEIILLDEPSIALDHINRRQVIDVLNSLSQTLIISSHDLDMILETCDRVIVLNEKGVVVDSDAESVLTNKEILNKCNLELPLCMQQLTMHGKR